MAENSTAKMQNWFLIALKRIYTARTLKRDLQRQNIHLCKYQSAYYGNQRIKTQPERLRVRAFLIRNAPTSFPRNRRLKYSIIRNQTEGLALKERQSVHWTTVGFASWVPTSILSREQKSSQLQWCSQLWIVQPMCLFANSVPIINFSFKARIARFSPRNYFEFRKTNYSRQKFPIKKLCRLSDRAVFSVNPRDRISQAPAKARHDQCDG